MTGITLTPARRRRCTPCASRRPRRSWRGVTLRARLRRDLRFQGQAWPSPRRPQYGRRGRPRAVGPGPGEAPMPWLSAPCRPSCRRRLPLAWRPAEASTAIAAQIALAFALGAYRFDRYRSRAESEPPRPGLVARAERRSGGVVRTPSPTPAPWRATWSTRWPTTWGRCRSRPSPARSPRRTARPWIVVTGDGLLEAELSGRPRAWGRAAAPARAPRMLELTWGDLGPRRCVALVGKGVVFDTGGLDIKPSGRHAADEEGHGRGRPRPGAWGGW